MIQKDHLANLIENLEQLNQARKHLETSLERCSRLTSKETLSETNLIEFEALTSRFARISDMLIHKIYRSIDAVELVEGGTLIDVLNRAAKRNLIDSLTEMRAMKDLRNDIAHEYITERLWILHNEVFTRVPKLLELVHRANEYAKKYIKGT